LQGLLLTYTNWFFVSVSKTGSSKIQGVHDSSMYARAGQVIFKKYLPLLLSIEWVKISAENYLLPALPGLFVDDKSNFISYPLVFYEEISSESSLLPKSPLK
jgi:hypothetical protein